MLKNGIETYRNENKISHIKNETQSMPNNSNHNGEKNAIRFVFVVHVHFESTHWRAQSTFHFIPFKSKKKRKLKNELFQLLFRTFCIEMVGWWMPWGIHSNQCGIDTFLAVFTKASKMWKTNRFWVYHIRNADMVDTSETAAEKSHLNEMMLWWNYFGELRFVNLITIRLQKKSKTIDTVLVKWSDTE